MWLLKNAVDGDEKLELVEEAKPDDDGDDDDEYTPQNRPDGDLDRRADPFDLVVLEDVIAIGEASRRRLKNFLEGFCCFSLKCPLRVIGSANLASLRRRIYS